MADSEPTLQTSAMGHVQPTVSPSLEEGRKRSMEPADDDAPLNKRLKSANVWQHETPPASPTESSSEASEDESDDDEDEDEPERAGYQGSILASCLLSDKRAPYCGEQEPPYGSACQLGRPAASAFPGWYADGSFHRPAQNQTVECDGKSYIQLGAVPPRRERSQFYRYQRFTVLHATMVKLSRHRRLMDPVLRKSVLLFNTIRHIERELEQEGLSLAAAFNPHHFDSGPLTLDPPPPPPTPTPPPPPPPPPAASAPTAAAAAATSPGNDSGFGDDEINWGSVLCLSSQPELELMAADGCASPLGGESSWQLTPLSADDVLRTFPADRRDDGDGGGLTSLLAL